MKTATPHPMPRTAVLPLIADPAGYRPETIDLIHDAAARDYWLDVFDHHTLGMAELAAAQDGNTDDAKARAAAFTRDFLADLARIRRDPPIYDDLSILRLCLLRREHLLRHGFPDPYRRMKQIENTAALAMLPGILAEIDALHGGEKLDRVMRGVFAGNIFDMGCRETIELYKSGRADFRSTLARLPARPWLNDDLDTLHRRFAERRHRKAIVFVDNAGADVTLGMIPLVRLFLERGTQVIVTANSEPALNDILHDELVEHVAKIAELDPLVRDAVATGRMKLVASGWMLPVIDMRKLSPELCEEARDADLLVIEGMGRSLETNYRTRFTVDTLKVAMVKEQIVADVLGGKMYDVVCRFEVGE